VFFMPEDYLANLDLVSRECAEDGVGIWYYCRMTKQADPTARPHPQKYQAPPIKVPSAVQFT